MIAPFLSPFLQSHFHCRILQGKSAELSLLPSSSPWVLGAAGEPQRMPGPTTPGSLLCQHWEEHIRTYVLLVSTQTPWENKSQINCKEIPEGQHLVYEPQGQIDKPSPVTGEGEKASFCRGSYSCFKMFQQGVNTVWCFVCSLISKIHQEKSNTSQSEIINQGI